MKYKEQRQLAEDVYAFFRSHYVAEDDLSVTDVIFVFGRKDAQFARVASNLYRAGAGNILVTGGVGKDSGDLRLLNIPEAHYLAVLMLEQGVAGSNLLVEPMATNGAANSRLGTEMIIKAGIPAEQIVLVGHPATLLRLSTVHTLVTRGMGFKAGYQLLAVDTDFDIDLEKDQQTILDECWRLYDYPKSTEQHPQPWADPIDIPTDLLERVLAWKALQMK